MVARTIINSRREVALDRIQAYAEAEADDSPEVSERIGALRDVRGPDEMHTQLFRLEAVADLLDAIKESRGEEPPTSNAATPAAQARALELDVDLDEVEGTGKGGRITVGDVEDHAKEDSDAEDLEEDSSEEEEDEE